ncbi:MAG: hypothetical protein HYR85_24065 [Planctomycetes bacterium]|nr:hypothetical protein [Planctomycetota bacterium]
MSQRLVPMIGVGELLAGLGVIVALFALKQVLFRRTHSTIVRPACFVAAIAAAVPVTWLISPDWHNRHVTPIANWVGDPIALLAVPVAAFVIALVRGRVGSSPWLFRLLSEVCFVGAWMWAWTFFEFCVLHWVWI